MARNNTFANMILYPLSLLYGFGVGVRGLMFKWNILKSKKFDVPVVVVGNLAVGGTGKTPHTEYIVKLLSENKKVGVLSRGYKRRSRGFIIVDDNSTPREVGDEPYQIYRKFADVSSVRVAVCERRVDGINKMLEQFPDIEIIVLDDAFQHRYVSPAVSIVLTEFNRPVFSDHLLPYGRLREGVEGLDRADIVVVTKCPDKLKPIEYRIFNNNLKLFHYQKLYFSHFDYGTPVAVFPNAVDVAPIPAYMGSSDSILCVAGIANPRPFFEYLKTFKPKLKIKVFPDHHDFAKKDLELILKMFNELKGENKVILTTEKDAVRMANNDDFPEELKSKIFYVPIDVRFENNGGDSFDQTLQTLIRNSTVISKPNKIFQKH